MLTGRSARTGSLPQEGRFAGDQTQVAQSPWRPRACSAPYEGRSAFEASSRSGPTAREQVGRLGSTLPRFSFGQVLGHRQSLWPLLVPDSSAAFVPQRSRGDAFPSLLVAGKPVFIGLRSICNYYEPPWRM